MIETMPNHHDLVMQPAWNYEETVAEIEAIIHRIESGELPLEAVFEQFGAAMDYLKQCDRFLSKGRENMELLIETLEESDDIEF